ncbi:MAG: response regulator [Nitrospirae bacterium]|nr:response regulator [Nitrospirota bacterium]
MRDETILKTLSALYVEDDAAMLDGLAKFMRRRFGDVYLAKNGKEGLELYITHNPDIVITDIEMPVMNGIVMINKILKIKNDQPIIITTAFNDDDHVSNRCVNLIKPINVERLIDAIFCCIEGKMREAM